MAGVPVEIPEELHDAWRSWFDHYRAAGSSPRRAGEEATATLSAHYLEPATSPTEVRRLRAPRATGPGPYAPERWQALCRHCGAPDHGEQTCAQASAGSLIALDRGAAVLEDEPRPNSPEDLGGWRAA